MYQISNQIVWAMIVIQSIKTLYQKNSIKVVKYKNYIY